MTLADRLNKVISESKLSKAKFARRIGVTPQYIILLTGNAKNRPKSMASSLAKLIALEFGCNENWLLHGEEPVNDKPVIYAHTCTGPLRAYGISVRENETLMQFAAGLHINQIAKADGVSVNTVKYYLRSAYKKLNVHSRNELKEFLAGVETMTNE